MQNEFPKQWPTFFDELLAMLSEGHRVVDMFCRIMNSIDEDVISLDIFRCAAAFPTKTVVCKHLRRSQSHMHSAA